MTMTESDRYHLHQQLEAALDERGANTMMELLPPVGWADVATKRDLDQLEERTDLRFDNVDLKLTQVDLRAEARTAKLRADLTEAGRKMQGTLLSAIAVATAVLAAVTAWGPG
ncbi:MAG: hypothetical protein R2704_15655 [Microthrixaceae bacterium]